MTAFYHNAELEDGDVYLNDVRNVKFEFIEDATNCTATIEAMKPDKTTSSGGSLSGQIATRKITFDTVGKWYFQCKLVSSGNDPIRTDTLEINVKELFK